MKQKMRIDLALVEAKLARSRSHAQDLIKRKQVKVDDQLVERNSLQVSEENRLELVNQDHYVSRGAHKLLSYLEKYPDDFLIKDQVWADIGSSTGGFTQVLLERGARRVIAIDVGTEQLDPKLRDKKEIHLLEKTHILKLEAFPVSLSFAVMDCSFISVKKILPHLFHLLSGEKACLVLYKPQFEVSPKALNQRGVVVQERLFYECWKEFVHFLRSYDLILNNFFKVPLEGKQGNQEYFLKLTQKGKEVPDALKLVVTDGG